ISVSRRSRRSPAWRRSWRGTSVLRVRADDSAARGGALRRMTRLAPRLEPAVEGDGARVAHRAERGGGERRDLAELAVREDARGGIGQLAVDTELELTAWQMTRARHVPRVVRVPLADVQDHEAPIPGRDALLHLLHRHERDASRRLAEELGDRLAAGAVGAQRLGQVLGHPEAQLAHLRDEGGALAPLEARVLRLLLAECRDRVPLVVVGGV